MSQSELLGKQQTELSNQASSAPQGGRSQGDAREEHPHRTVNIRRVPAWVWKRARQNALASDMSFQDYVTMLLAESQPYPQG